MVSEYLNWDLGLQLVLVALSVIGVMLNNKKKTCNFYFFMVTYTVWAVLYWYHGVYGAALKELIFIGFNIQGLMMWRRDDEQAKRH